MEAGKIATYALLGKEGFEDKLKELKGNAKKSKDYIV